MTAPHFLGARFRHHGAHRRPHQSAVEALIDFGNASHGGKGEVVLGTVAAELADIAERAGLQAEQVIALHQLGVFDILVQTRDYRLVETGGHQIDHVHGIGELAMLLCRHFAGHENAEVPNALMQAIDDRLAVCDDLVLVIVQIENPVQCLLRWGDVVAPGTEHDDRRFDVAHIDAQSSGGAQLARRELVADEQLVGDRLHFSRIHQHGAAPPLLEFEKPRRLRIDL